MLFRRSNRNCQAKCTQTRRIILLHCGQWGCSCRKSFKWMFCGWVDWPTPAIGEANQPFLYCRSAIGANVSDAEEKPYRARMLLLILMVLWKGRITCSMCFADARRTGTVSSTSITTRTSLYLGYLFLLLFFSVPNFNGGCCVCLFSVRLAAEVVTVHRSIDTSAATFVWSMAIRANSSSTGPIRSRQTGWILIHRSYLFTLKGMEHLRTHGRV